MSMLFIIGAEHGVRGKLLFLPAEVTYITVLTDG
jgi:hypothetical protein